jgi:multimeric flavodoxin WrbA
MLLNMVLEPIRAAGIDTEVIQMGSQPIWGCRACYKCLERQNRKCTVTTDRVNEYIQKLLEADGILIGTPTYFSGPSAQTKAFIDRTGLVCRVNGNLLARKVGAGVVAVRRAGAVEAFSAINYYFLIGEAIVPGSIYWNLAVGRNPGDVAGDEEGVKTMQRLGENMVWLLRKLNG